jgi:hypothetical protein
MGHQKPEPALQAQQTLDGCRLEGQLIPGDNPAACRKDLFQGGTGSLDQLISTGHQGQFWEQLLLAGSKRKDLGVLWFDVVLDFGLNAFNFGRRLIQFLTEDGVAFMNRCCRRMPGVRVFRLTLSKLCFKFRSVSLCVTNLKYF